jgi:hypothetical protein
MERKQVIKIVTWSTIALLIPILGQFFVEGWNWGLGDFVFAWVFFILLSFSYIFTTNKIYNPKGKILAGIGVVTIFAFIWVMLATG